MAFDDLLDEYDRRMRAALAMGGEERLERRRNAGLMNARERIAYLMDEGSFVESGLFAVSHLPEDRESTPADGKITGYGRIDGREAALVANDFTVKGASSSTTNMKKIGWVKRAATERGIPMVFLGESSGARIPDNMGAYNMGAMLAWDPAQYLRLRQSPWASAVLGMAYGSSTWYACMADFNVMRKGSIMAVSSQRLVSMAIGEQVDAEELGGWRLHTEVTGLMDLAVDSDEEALDAIKTFLGYMPSHHNEMPPEAPVPKGSDETARKVLDLLPEKRTQVYDMRKVIAALADKDSMFELKARFGRTAVTSLARLDGKVVGFIANNPLHKGGALDADGCDKACSFMVLCDSFNIPLVFLVDNPGFVIGLDAERQRAPGKIINFMNALQLVTTPKLTVMIRKNYGQAYINMAGGRNADEVAAWPTAEVSFMDPAFAVNVVHGNEGKRLEDDDPKLFEKKFEEFRLASEVWDIAAAYGVQHVIKPEDTRAWLIRMFEVHMARLTGGLSQHRLANWPTSY
ncbi:MAG: carboxyl transferase domain-containing protein [Alphaproteobacteria bacterium]|jgi:acetyl-CoA carboxylase carboxyltransferase component|nr:carboxyl transferase domain-containing protein [Alphaproteobacteria bacterium]